MRMRSTYAVGRRSAGVRYDMVGLGRDLEPKCAQGNLYFLSAHLSAQGFMGKSLRSMGTIPDVAHCGPAADDARLVHRCHFNTVKMSGKDKIVGEKCLLVRLQHSTGRRRC